MTQKEYKEKIYELEKENKNLRKDLDFERSKTYNYERVLEDYHITNEELRNEKEYNRQNICTIERLQKTIEQYEKILERVSISC